MQENHHDIKPSITCSSKDSMYDAPIHIKVEGLQPSQEVTLHAITTIDNGNKFETLANYVAGADGCIDLSRDRSVGGRFRGVEPMGLFWSMKPSPANKTEYARLMKINVSTPLVFTITLYDGFIKTIHQTYQLRKSNLLRKRCLAQTSSNRWMKSRDTERIELDFEKDGIYGTLFIPAGKGPFPGVITMFGSFPGTLEFKASLLASHGFASLALSYVGLPGLPALDLVSEIKLEYFEKAIQVFLSHPKVDKSVGVGVVGLSFSTSIILAMGALLPSVKCVVWISGYTYPFFGSLSYKGKKIQEQNIRNVENAIVSYGASDALYIGRVVYPIYRNPFCKELDESRIPYYNRHDVAYMFISGLSDGSVPAEHFINQAGIALKASNHPNYKLLRYPGAGHLLEPCYGTHQKITPHKTFGVMVEWGGEMVAHCRAQEHSWYKQINFLKTNLKRTSIDAKL